ncbi:sugar O-acyltransferase [bacterium]|nr:sugar O-acyltransferase [bacterium]
MSRKLVILGTSGNAYDILDLVDAINRSGTVWEIAGFLDDARARGSRCEDYEVLGGVRDAANLTGVEFVNTIGGDRTFRKRAELVAMMGVPPERFATLVHPAALVSRRARLGAGTCVNGLARVASGVSIGNHVWLGTGCTVDFGGGVDDFVLVGPGALIGGGVRVESSAYIGAGAALRQRVVVGRKAQVGLGAVVIGDVAAGTTVVGNPARTLVRTATTGGPKADRGPTDTPPPRTGV